MQQSSIFRWRDGMGWLVLSSGAHDRGETEAADMAALTRSAADGPLVVIGAACAASDDPERYLSYLGDLGGRSGYTLDIVVEDDFSLRTQLAEAGIIIICDGPQKTRLFNGMHGAVIEAIGQAYAHGGLVMGVGIGAEIFGEWIVDLAGIGPTVPGFAWLAGAAVLTGLSDGRQVQHLRDFLKANPTAYGLSIRPGSALALGPDGQIELWGTQQISIALGQAYSVRDHEP